MTRQESDAITIKLLRDLLTRLENDSFEWPETHLQQVRDMIASVEARTYGE